MVTFLPDADPCGLLDTPCCMIPDNDPNGGVCDDLFVSQCWAGECIPCGLDGGPACNGTVPTPVQSPSPLTVHSRLCRSWCLSWCTMHVPACG